MPCSGQVEFPLPDMTERCKLIKQYYAEHLGKAPLMASPRPATHAMVTVLEAGERMSQALY